MDDGVQRRWRLREMACKIAANWSIYLRDSANEVGARFMRNRRQDYRHCFDDKRRLMVKLSSLDERESVIGEVVNLSIGGLCIQSDTLRGSKLDQWIATCMLEPGMPPVKALVEVVYASPSRPTAAGLHFVPSSDLTIQEERERKIWRFLLAEQRRERQERLEEARARRDRSIG